MGLPPRVRGKEQVRDFRPANTRITPACAGKRKQEHGQKNRSGDHPRVCGEKCACTAKPMPLWGSPPRMRGKVPTIPVSIHSLGITPACAGKRADCPTWGCTGWDHPRVCGEKGCWKFSSRNHSGSPPRMRGKAPLRAWIGCAPGITPAYAGKRHERSSSRTNRRDYPRVCGEKADNDYDEKPIEGSPPRMRGKGPLPRDALPALGITPAYAGKSLWSGSVRVWVWDHPRVCGEKVAVCHDHASGVGSPPRMRGKD